VRGAEARLDPEPDFARGRRRRQRRRRRRRRRRQRGGVCGGVCGGGGRREVSRGGGPRSRGRGSLGARGEGERGDVEGVGVCGLFGGGGGGCTGSGRGAVLADAHFVLLLSRSRRG